jgi:hypothetical protein
LEAIENFRILKEEKMKRLSLLLILTLAITPLVWSGVGEGSAKYVDGSAPGLKKGMEGVTHADGPLEFIFDYKKGDFRIPFLQITGLHYGNKSHMTVRYSVFMGVHPSKAHDYMLTIDYTDANKAPQTVEFMLGKSRIWNTLINLQSKSGQKIQFDNQEACKQAAHDAPPGQMDCGDIPAAPAEEKGKK